jgi:hypothetical protein
MNRRKFIKWLPAVGSALHSFGALASLVPTSFTRVRPGDASWPSEQQWEMLRAQLGGRLAKLAPLLTGCEEESATDICHDLRAGRNAQTL